MEFENIRVQLSRAHPLPTPPTAAGRQADFGDFIFLAEKKKSRGRRGIRLRCHVESFILH